MKMLKGCLFGLFLLGVCSPVIGQQQVHPELVKYVEFLEGQDTPAKEYVMSLFEENDIVVLCEAMHEEISQYGLVHEILGDERFVGGLLFTEVGSTGITADLNAFLQGPELQEDELKSALLDLQRRFYWQPWFRNGSSYDLMHAVYEINRNAVKKVEWYPTDVFFDWEAEFEEDRLARFMSEDVEWRDSLMAGHIISVYDSVYAAREVKPKALVIMNYRHAYGNDFVRDPGQKPQNAGRYLFEHYPGRIANVFIHQLSFLAMKGGEPVYSLPLDGRWDAAFSIVGKSDIGFSFRGTPFGEDDFDNWIMNKGVHRYQDVFNGYVFYKPAHEWIYSEGVQGLMDDGHDEKVIDMLLKIEGMGPEYIEMVREWLQERNERIERPYLGKEELGVRDKWLE